MPEDAQIRAAILELLDKRGPGKSICPSEAARKLSSDGNEWRNLMPAIRQTAAILADEGALVVTQRGEPVDPDTARGPIRLSRSLP